MFIQQCDRRRFGKLVEELENDYTKGNDNYPQDLVSAYRLLSEYKNWQRYQNVPEATSVAFVNKQSTDGFEEWAKKQTCHLCGKKGHVKPQCPDVNKNKEDSDEDVQDDDSDKEEKSRQI
jgi:hypothetical protein